MTTTATESVFSVRISQDKLSAQIALARQADPQQVTLEMVVKALKESKIEITNHVKARAVKYCEALKAKEIQLQSFLVAKGTAPQPGKDGFFSLAPNLIQTSGGSDEEEGSVDFRASTSIAVVEDGDSIGTISAPEPSVPGRDVHGAEIPYPTDPIETEIGENVEMAEDGKTVKATTPGLVIQGKQSVSVRDVIEISGDVDYETGNLDVPSDLVVRRNIKDLFKVVTEKSLTVGGAIEAAEVEAADEVRVRGGILGHGKGFVHAGKEITVRFCVEANLKSKSSIIIDREILNSSIHSGGSVSIPLGSIIGGKVYAQHAIEAKVFGSDAGVATNIEVGVPVHLYRELAQQAEESKKKRTAITRIRETVAPLLANAKRLSTEQKEKATEMMFQADSLELEIKKADEKLAQQIEATSVGPDGQSPYVLVNDRVCQGVRIRVNDRVAIFRKDMKGPIKISKKMIKNHTVLAATNMLTGSLTEILSRELEPDEMEESESSSTDSEEKKK